MQSKIYSNGLKMDLPLLMIIASAIDSIIKITIHLYFTGIKRQFETVSKMTSGSIHLYLCPMALSEAD